MPEPSLITVQDRDIFNPKSEYFAMTLNEKE